MPPLVIQDLAYVLDYFPSYACYVQPITSAISYVPIVIMVLQIVLITYNLIIKRCQSCGIIG